MIGISMEHWTTTQIQRVADAKLWTSGSATDPEGGRCLVTHAVNDGRFDWYPERGELVGFKGGIAPLTRGLRPFSGYSIHYRFDRIAEKLGVDIARILCQNRARRILARRTLNALNPDAARLLVGP